MKTGGGDAALTRSGTPTLPPKGGAHGVTRPAFFIEGGVRTYVVNNGRKHGNCHGIRLRTGVNKFFGKFSHRDSGCHDRPARLVGVMKTNDAQMNEVERRTTALVFEQQPRES